MDERSGEFLDAYSKQIARITIGSAYLEDSLCEIISACLLLNELQRNALVRPMGARAKLDLIDRLAKTVLTNPSDRKAVKEFTSKAKTAFEQRNELVHGLFGHNLAGEITVRSYSGQTKLTGEPKRWGIDAASHLADEILRIDAETDRISRLLANHAPHREDRGQAPQH